VQFVRETDFGSTGFDQVQVGEVALVQFFDHEGEKLSGLAIVDATILAEGRKTDAEPIRADGSADFLDNLQKEARPILLRATLLIGACVGSVFQELFNQVAICSLQFYPLKARLDDIQSSFAKGADDDWNLGDV